MKKRASILWTVGLSGLLLAGSAAALGVTQTVNGNVLTAQIELLGGIEADVTLTFENVGGLTVQNVGLSAKVLTILDLVQLGVWPLNGLSIPAAFPLLITIDPPPGSPLQFHGTVAFELHTHNLNFVSGSLLRLFYTPLGGPLQDVTTSTGAGSFIFGTSQPEFPNQSYNRSSYVVLFDARSLASVTNLKLDQLDEVLADHAILVAPALLDELEDRLSALRSAVENGNMAQALGELEEFTATVEEQSGSGLPDLWRADESLVNLAGKLRSAAATLRFSLIEQANSPF